MKGYYINLAKSADRRSFMENNLVTKHFTRVEAVYPGIIPSSVVVPDKIHYITDTEKGCFLSHLKTWRMIVNKAEPYAVVCEDDVDLGIDFFDVLPPYTGFDFVHLVPSRNKITGEVKSECLDFYTTACYIISKLLCEKLVKQYDEDNKVYIADFFSLYLPDDIKILSYNSSAVRYAPHAKHTTIEMGRIKALKSYLLSKGVKVKNWMV